MALAQRGPADRLDRSGRRMPKHAEPMQAFVMRSKLLYAQEPGGQQAKDCRASAGKAVLPQGLTA
jgi:hypothetical protein